MTSTHSTAVTGHEGRYLTSCSCGWSRGWVHGHDAAEAAGAEHRRERDAGAALLAAAGRQHQGEGLGAGPVGSRPGPAEPAP